MLARLNVTSQRVLLAGGATITLAFSTHFQERFLDTFERMKAHKAAHVADSFTLRRCCKRVYLFFVTLKKVFGHWMWRVPCARRKIIWFSCLRSVLVYAGVAYLPVGWPKVLTGSGSSYWVYFQMVLSAAVYGCLELVIKLFYFRRNATVTVRDPCCWNWNCGFIYGGKIHTWSNRKDSKLTLSLRQKPYFLLWFMFRTHLWVYTC